jgi:class 3 adenylate cyclase
MSNLEYAVVLFCDLRGFTNWSATAQVAHHLQPFMSDFFRIFQDAVKADSQVFIKPNGDGVLWVNSTGTDNEPLDLVLDNLLDRALPFVDAQFSNLVQRYQRIMRCAIPLRLAYGINAGIVHRLQFTLDGQNILVDFASGTLNTAARLCDLARPQGVVIAQEAFPDWSPKPEHGFELVQIPVRNVSDSYPVWISRAAAAGSPRERLQIALEFHVGTVCYDPRTGTVVLALRNKDREIYPGLWETGGGQMFRGEGIEETAKRIAQTEFGLSISVTMESGVVPFRINLARKTIPGVKMLGIVHEENLRGYKDQRQHSEIRRVLLDELFSEQAWPSNSLIPGTKGVIKELVERYRRANS